jgi:putative nucleotidyltransferase with HDIG domain
VAYRLPYPPGRKEETDFMMDSMLIPVTTEVPEPLQAAVMARINANDIELPLLPNVVWQVMAMSNSDDADARKLSELIHRDQALASHLLRVANSPAYMPRMPIVSLQQAICRLGFKQLAEIAFAISLHTRVFEVAGYEHEVRVLWQHAVGTAIYASEIARWRRQNVEGSFLSGLLHDIGKPIVLQLIVDEQKALGCTVGPAAVAALIEAHHTYVGGLLATEWALPQHVYESIVYHHDYLMAPTCVQMVMVTRLADQLSYHLLEPEIFDVASIYQLPVLADLNLYPDDVESFLAMRDKIQLTAEAMT